MIWEQKGTRWLAWPYQILFGVRGYEAWVHSAKKYAVIGRDIQTIDEAKALCETHVTTEAA